MRSVVQNEEPALVAAPAGHALLAMFLARRRRMAPLVPDANRYQDLPEREGVRGLVLGEPRPRPALVGYFEEYGIATVTEALEVAL
ncbi:MAG: hypothetical protein QM767_05025 [Anaeromyxobacter sp.]